MSGWHDPALSAAIRTAEPDQADGTAVLLTDIAQLVTCDGPDDSPASALGIIEDAALIHQHGEIVWLGAASQAPPADHAISLGRRTITPGFVDSHTHLIFAGERSGEFAARMAGVPYDGGGIASTVAATRGADDGELSASLHTRLAQMWAQGTTTVEIKSGYGLDVETERRLVELASTVTHEVTYLGGHVVPAEFRDNRSAYVDLVAGEMLRACAPRARWIDVFCEPASPHAFDADEARTILLAGRSAGLLPRVHGNQLAPGPGVQLAVELGAASVDHCTYLSSADVDALVDSAETTVATLLPGVEFSTRSPYPDARGLLDAGVSIALATDCNPGTCYSNSMPFVIALAVREMRMTPAEALFAATRGAARALRRDNIGRIAVGLNAELAVLDAPSYVHLAYRPGVPIATTLMALAKD